MSEDFFLLNPVATRFFVTDPFNSPRPKYRASSNRLHEGIDLLAKEGGRPVAVLAAQRGVVDRVELFKPTPEKPKGEGYGTYVRVRHDWPDGTTWFTWYGHLSQIETGIQPGVLLQARQRLGTAGDTGNADGIHLHLTAQHSGHGLKKYVVDDVVNPTNLFRHDNARLPPVDEARYVADVTVPDGMQFEAGQPFEKKWTIRNVGSTTWDSGYTLAFFEGNQMGGPVSVLLPPLEPGEQGEVAVPLIAPTARGRQRSIWKGRNPRGEFFPFELVVDIKVAPSSQRDDAEFANQETVLDGTVMQPGETFLKMWKMHNTGNTKWGAGYGLAFLRDHPMGAPAVVPVPTTRLGSLVPLEVSLTAPTTPGTHRSTWQMRNPEGKFFGQTIWAEIVVAAPVTLGAGQDAATFVDDVTIDDGTRLVAGERFEKVWRLRNAGKTTWGAGYVLAFVSDHQMGGPNAVPLPAAEPGATVDVAVLLTAPTTPGRHKSFWQPRNPDNEFFGDPVFADIEVVQPETLDDFRFVNDITIPDGSLIQAGELFHKTWRLRNAGRAAWGAGYTLVFQGGEQMNAPDRVPLPPALPGQEVDVTVTFTGPATPGVLRSTWQPQNPNGQFFGRTIFVEIRVPAPLPITEQVNDSRLETHEVIPNGTEMPPGNAFTKIWAIRNIGTTTWGAGYTLAFVDGEQMGAPVSVAAPPTEPQRVARLKVPMKAPPTPGKHSGRWRMRDPQGNLFGSPIFISIVVTPLTEQLDLLPFLKGDRRLYEMKHIFQTSTGQQRLQTQVDENDNDRFYTTKDREWEELWADNDFIYRGTDTSPGMGNFYTLTENGRYGSPWTPRQMAIGQTFLRSPTVTSRRKDNCAINPQLSGQHLTWIKLEAHHERLTLPDVEGRPTGGMEVQDVIVLAAHHNHNNQPSAQPFERYFYARKFGLVMWEGIDVDHRGRSFMVEVHQPGARPDNVREQIPCLEAIRRGGNA